MRVEVYRTIGALMGELSNLRVLSVVIAISVFFGTVPEAFISFVDFFIEMNKNALIKAVILALVSIALGYYLYKEYENLKERFSNLEYAVEKVEPSNIEVLVTALSKPNDTEIEEELKNGIVKDFEYYRAFSWYPNLLKIKDIKEKGKLKKVVVITSEEVKPSLVHFERLVKNFFPDVGLENYGDVDMSDFENIQRHLKEVLQKLTEEGYKGKHIAIGITSGTTSYSVVASALSFSSNMLLVYMLQNKKELVYVDMKPIEMV